MHIKTANGKKTISMSQKEWRQIGKRAGWIQMVPKNKLQDQLGRLMRATQALVGDMNGVIPDEKTTLKEQLHDALDNAGDAFNNLNDIAAVL